jgi:general L-amino acid transport system substrate-binding protein
VAAAVLGDSTAVEFIPLTAAERFTALLDEDIDVLIRNTTWTQGRDVPLDFGPTTFYDGQKLMGESPAFSADSTIADIDGATVCVQSGSTSLENIQNAADQAGVTITIEETVDVAEAATKLLDGTCDLMTTDESGLVSVRYDLGNDGDDLVIFPGTPISKEPLGPTYRADDSAWGDVVNWTVLAMIIADEKGITRANVTDTWDDDPESTALFGGENERQTAMGLDATAFREVIEQVGNYDEVFEANLEPVGFSRTGTLNARFGEDGGLIFAPPADGSVPGDGEPAPAGDESALEMVQDRGMLNCGVNAGLTGFGVIDDDDASGFDIDFCRAVAAAVLGDATAVDFVPLTSAERFDALADGTIDLLIRNTTWTQGRDVAFDFGPTTFYDGQKLMGESPAFSADSTIADIDGATVCVQSGTTSLENIQNAADQAGVTITIEETVDIAEATTKLLDGTCDLMTTDESGLVSVRFDLLGSGGDDLVIFPGTPISKEPLGPTYRANDSTWGDVVNWTVLAMIIADEKGITRANVADTWDDDPESMALFGGDGERQSAMGLDADAFREVIEQVGNYDEVFEANLVPVGFSRAGTLNAGFGAGGGLIFAPPAGGSVPE